MQRILISAMAVVLFDWSAALAECKCAIAMVSEGGCEKCKDAYANGKKSKTTTSGG